MPWKPKTEKQPRSPDNVVWGNRITRGEMVAQLFEQHNEALVQHLIPLAKSEQEARDIAQEAYVRILELDSRRPSYIRAYLFQTAINIATDRSRMRVNRERLLTEKVHPLDGQLAPPSPERIVSAQEEVALVRQFLDDLPPRVQQAFYLHRFRGFNGDEIAVEMGLSTRMVRKYICRALEYCVEKMRLAQGVSRE